MVLSPDMNFLPKTGGFITPVLATLSNFLETKKGVSKTKTSAKKKEIVISSLSDFETVRNVVSSINKLIEQSNNDYFMKLSPEEAQVLLKKMNEREPIFEKYDKILNALEPSTTSEFKLQQTFIRFLHLILDGKEILQIISERGDIDENSDGYLNMIDEYIEAGRSTKIEKSGISVKELLSDC